MAPLEAGTTPIIVAKHDAIWTTFRCGSQGGSVTSLPDYTAAKDRARQHRLDRLVMERAKHLKVTR